MKCWRMAGLAVALSSLLCLSACGEEEGNLMSGESVEEYSGSNERDDPEDGPVAAAEEDEQAESTPEPTPASTPTPAPTPTPVLSAPVSDNYVEMAPTVFYADVQEYLTLREKPDSGAAEIAKIAPGEYLAQVGVSGRFSQVVTEGGLEGYVMQRYLVPIEEFAELAELSIVDVYDENYSYEKMLYEIEALCAQYPQDATYYIDGYTLGGRGIVRLRIGEEDAPIQILVQAAIHGREYMTAQLAMKQAEYLLYCMRDYAHDYTYSGQPLGELLDGVAFHIYPMVNPDGVALSSSNDPGLFGSSVEAELEGIRQMDMANGRVTEEQGENYFRLWKANLNGVDINRNFPTDWGLRVAASETSLSDFPGAAAGSEIETRVLMACVEDGEASGNPFAAAVSLHSFGSEIYWQSAVDLDLQQRTLELAQRINRMTGYPLLEDTTTYAGGGFKDWVMKEKGVPSVTIEIGLQASPLPASEFPLLWQRNREMLLAVAEWAKG